MLKTNSAWGSTRDAWGVDNIGRSVGMGLDYNGVHRAWPIRPR